MTLAQAAKILANRYPQSVVVRHGKEWQVLDSPVHWEGGLSGGFTQKPVGPWKPTHRQAVIAAAELAMVPVIESREWTRSDGYQVRDFFAFTIGVREEAWKQARLFLAQIREKGMSGYVDAGTSDRFGARVIYSPY